MKTFFTNIKLYDDIRKLIVFANETYLSDINIFMSIDKTVFFYIEIT